MAPGALTAEGRTFQELTLPDLTLPHESEDGVLTNKYDLLCPRGCRSVILKRGVGKLVERSGIEVRPMDIEVILILVVNANCASDGFPWTSHRSRSGSASGTTCDGAMVACYTISDGV